MQKTSITIRSFCLFVLFIIGALPAIGQMTTEQLYSQIQLSKHKFVKVTVHETISLDGASKIIHQYELDVEKQIIHESGTNVMWGEIDAYHTPSGTYQRQQNGEWKFYQKINRWDILVNKLGLIGLNTADRKTIRQSTAQPDGQKNATYMLSPDSYLSDGIVVFLKDAKVSEVHWLRGCFTIEKYSVEYPNTQEIVTPKSVKDVPAYSENWAEIEEYWTYLDEEPEIMMKRNINKIENVTIPPPFDKNKKDGFLLFCAQNAVFYPEFEDKTPSKVTVEIAVDPNECKVINMEPKLNDCRGSEIRRLVAYSWSKWDMNSAENFGNYASTRYIFKISFDFEQLKKWKNDNTLATGIDYVGASNPSAQNEDKLYELVDKAAEYPGGQAAIMNFISLNLRYPQEARDKKIQGTAIVQVIVRKDGSLTDIKVQKDPGGGCGEELARVLKLMPKWTPAMNEGKPVSTRINFPFRFSLE
jgi:TonB family protein